MDPSWHHHHHHYRPPPPPPVEGNICPVCSMSHFPFCLPPFPQNYPPIHHHHHPQHPPPHPDQFYPRPPLPLPPPPPIPPPPPAYDPFVDHFGGQGPGPVVDPHHQFLDSQQLPWSSNSGFDRDPRGVLYADDYYSNVGVKRMRFDNSGFSSSPTRNYANDHPVNPYSDDERRLKLIRDHGVAMSGEDDRNSGEKRSFDEINDMGFKPKNGFLTSSSLNTDFGRKENFFGQESKDQKNEEGKYGQQYKADYGLLRDNQVDGSLHQANAYEYNRLRLDSVEQTWQSTEAMGYNWQGVSRANSVYNDQRSGFGREFHTLDNQFVDKYAMQHGMESKLNQYGLPYLNNQRPPPLPISPPPPPLTKESSGQHMLEPVFSSSPSGSSASLFPILPTSSAGGPSSYPPAPPEYHSNKGHVRASTDFGSEELQAIRQAPYKTYIGGSEVVAQRPLSPDKPQVIDASHIIKHPHRATRPGHIVIILRGLPGSGKSYLAKMLRDLEVEHGGNVPRIHSMDDYFMTEVEKVEESEVVKTSGTVRGKKTITKKVMEFSYEPEMEEAYRSSMLKAFKKTLDDRVFNFVIVDDRNLRVADFAQFWATAKRSGFEVYLLEATYKDPAGCAARNVHGFIQDDIQKMADLWEEAPSLYLKLDIKSLLHGDGLEENGIQEVDMDMEDEDTVGGQSGSEESNDEKLVVPPVGGLVSDGSLNEDQRWDTEADHPSEEVKELGKSKWSNDLNEDDILKTEANENSTALSGLIQSYSKEGKSVRWGDQVHNSGFSIAAAKTANVASLVIGPGAGYNMKSNPLSDEQKVTASRKTGESKKQNVFQDQLRAEHESFKAAFDKRKQRISGLSGEED